VDDPYFAVALAHDSPIWSDEGAFQEQDTVKTYTTNTLAERCDI
jgi:predicted nucleic acid-binding protein